MNYSGIFDAKLAAGGSGLHSGVHLETVSPHATEAPADAIVVPDAQLLFNGDFKRAGVDLILSKDGRELVLQDYFKGEKHAALCSPDGARLTGDIVDALTGHTQFAQADGNAGAGRVIGHVTKLAGTATAIRNGVSIILHQGDNVEKGDVVQSGSGSTLGITFIDGTVFGLSSNARMVLNEMVYDPNGSNNSSLLSLVQGTITFVAGETAKHGDMKVNTPVATMGIRGTAVLVEIDFTVPGQGGAPPVKFHVLAEPDGHTGSYLLYSLTDPNVVLGQVNLANQIWTVTASGDLSTSPAPPLSLAAQEIIGQTFQTFFQSGPPNNANPRSNGPPGSTPANPPTPGKPDDTSPLKFDTGTPKTVIIPINLPAPTPTNPGAINPFATPIPVTFTVLKAIDVTPVVDTPSFNIGDQVTISDSFSSDTLVPYVPGTATILSVVGPAPAGINLASLVSVDPQTGKVTYNPQSFAFLQAGQKVTVTVGFDSQAGANIFQETLTLTIDNVLPTVTIATPGGATSSRTQTISGAVADGHAAVGATVTLYDTVNGVTKQIGTATVQPDGSWTATVTLSGDGTHSIVAVDTDAAGNTGSSAPVVLTLDTLAPTVTITTAAETSDVATRTISGVVADGHAAIGATVTLFDTVNGVTKQIGTATVQPDGSWTATVTLSGDGTHSIVAVDTDAAGNTGSSAPVVLTLDTLAPTVTITTAAETSDVATRTISGTVTAAEAAVGATVILYDTVNGVTKQIGTATVQPDGSWTATVTLSGDGTHSIVAVDTDAAGNTGSSAPVVLTLDTLAPTVTITTAAETSDVATRTISGVVADGHAAIGATVTLFDTVNGVTKQIGTATVQPDGSWTATVTLSGDGTHSIVAVDTDAAGNTGSSAPVVLTLDTLAPTVTITTAAETSDVATRTISGTVTAAEAAVGATVILYDTVNGVTKQIGTATVQPDGSWTATVTLSGDGTHSIVAVDTDAAGNTGSSAPVVLTLTGPVWASHGSGSWSAPGNWNTGVVPGVNDHAEINFSNITVTVSATFAVGTLSSKATLDIASHGDLTISGAGGHSSNSGTIEIHGVLELDGGMLDNSGTEGHPGFITIDHHGALILNGATIKGGIIDDYSYGDEGVHAGLIVTGSSKIEDHAVLNHGDVKVENGATLALDDVTVNGTKFTDTGTLLVDGHHTLMLDGATINAVELNIEGTLELADGSAIENGTLINSHRMDVSGSDVLRHETVTNTGILEVQACAALTLDRDTIVANTRGTITVDDGANLTLKDSTIDGGKLNIRGTLELTDHSAIQCGTLVNSHQIDVNGSAVLYQETINNHGLLDVLAGGALNLDQGTAVANAGGFITIDHRGTLILDGATIEGGTIDDYSTVSAVVIPGDIDITGSSTIDGGASLNNGNVTIESGQTLTLDGVTVNGGIVADRGVVHVDAGQTLKLNGVTLSGGSITNAGTIEITGDSTISSDVLSNTWLTVSSDQALTLDGATITGGAVTNWVDGIIDLNGSAVLQHGALGNFGQIDVSGSGNALDGEIVIVNYAIEVLAGGGLLLDHGTSVLNGGGAIAVDGNATLELSDASISGGTITASSARDDGAVLAGLIEVTGSSKIDGHAVLNDGDVTVEASATLTLNDVTVHGTTFSDTGTLMVDSGNTLTLDGATISGGTIDIGGGITAFSFGDDGAIFSGLIDVTGSSKIDGAILNGGDVSVERSATLTLDDVAVTGGKVTDKGAIQVDSGKTLTLDDVTITGVTIANHGTIDITGNTVITSAITGNGSINVIATIHNETLTGYGSGDNFVFNFSGFGHDTVTNFDPAHEVLEFNAAAFNSLTSILASAHSDGHGDTVITVDAQHDTITLKNVSIEQLRMHPNDFQLLS